MVLVKYYGLVFDEKDKKWQPRHEFLTNGLFRMTQPKYLNDRGSETKFFPYFDEFSPADIAWAKKQHDKMQVDSSYKPSREELENFHLKPTGVRYGDLFPHMVADQSGFSSMEEYDSKQFIKTIEGFNRSIVEVLSCQLGVLSLSKSDTNELMWTHYASEGKGIAVSFNKDHSFFKQLIPRDVNYSPEKRATFTYYKGSLRINGEPIDNFCVSDLKNPLTIYGALTGKGVNVTELSERLLYSKAEKWASEDESRLVCPFSFCEETRGDIVNPEVAGNLSKSTSKILRSYSEIYLKKIPFDAFESIIFGFNMSEPDKEFISNKIKSNKSLSHVKLKVAQHNIYGDVEIVDLVV